MHSYFTVEYLPLPTTREHPLHPAGSRETICFLYVIQFQTH